MLGYLADKVETNRLDKKTRGALCDSLFLTAPKKSFIDSPLYESLRNVSSSLRKRDKHDLSYLASFCHCMYADMNKVAKETSKEIDAVLKNVNKQIENRRIDRKKVRDEVRKRTRLN